MDAYYHVNNAGYLTYLEEVRDEWLERTLGGSGDVWNYALARVAIDFRNRESGRSRRLTAEERAAFEREAAG